jgi:uroporphyrinogen decarboxylase
MKKSFSSVKVTPDWRGFVDCILRKGTPRRVYYIELFLDGEIQNAICERYGLLDGLDPADEFFPHQKQIRIQRFLGYDFVRCGVENMNMPLRSTQAQDTAALRRESGRHWMEEHKGPITTWEDFKSYPWPDPHQADTRTLEWYSENLPEDMCIIGSGGFAHFCEYITWLMGYESLCFALYDQRDLVKAIADRLNEMYDIVIRKLLKFERVKVVWGSDDMGFKTGTLIGPDDMREFCLAGHKHMAHLSHQAGRPYLLHSCGNLSSIMEDLIEDVRIDAKHSFEDTIEDVRELKGRYGDRLTLLGGIDVDFMCRSGVKEVRRRVRDTLDRCMPGGGYCLGSGNSVANYIPLENYLAMLDEGRKFKP